MREFWFLVHTTCVTCIAWIPALETTAVVRLFKYQLKLTSLGWATYLGTQHHPQLKRLEISINIWRWLCCRSPGCSNAVALAADETAAATDGTDRRTPDHYTDPAPHIMSVASHTQLFNNPFPGLPRSAGTRKVKPIWILLKQETASGSSISWAVCKYAPRSRQTTMPAPHHSVASI